jgi:1,4-alpha-glucan branching enzyme
MSKDQTKKEARRKRVTFKLEAPEAKEVCLMGDFNNWNAKTHTMKMDKNRIWNKIVMLYPGRYEYQFLVDGQWKNDPKNEQTVPNRFGTRNNVLQVS